MCNKDGCVRHNWGAKLQDIGAIYECVHLDLRQYVGEGLSYTERIKEKWQL